MRPILLIPGISGSILVDKTKTHKQLLHWKLLDNRWLNLYPYSKSAVRRWKKDMRYEPKRDDLGRVIGLTNFSNPNIDVYDFGGTLGLKDVVSEFLLLSNEHQQTLENEFHFRYFHALTEYFYQRNYTDHMSLVGLPYDFRIILDPVSRTRMFMAFKDRIEAAVDMNGAGGAVVVSHSFGGIMFKWMIHELGLDETWMRRYIHRWVCISCPFGGAPFALRAAITGDYYLPLFHKVFKEELNMNGSMIACLPNDLAYNSSHTLIHVGDRRKIGIHDYKDLGMKDGYIAFEMWKELFEPYLEMLKQPLPIHTHIVRTNQLDTPDAFYVRTLEDYPMKMEYTSGDGVVSNPSLMAYQKILIPQLTRDMIVPFSDHTALISDKRVLHLIDHYARNSTKMKF